MSYGYFPPIVLHSDRGRQWFIGGQKWNPDKQGRPCNTGDEAIMELLICYVYDQLAELSIVVSVFRYLNFFVSVQ